MSILNELATTRILSRGPIAKGEVPWLTAYKTKGGTYVIATSGEQDDNHKPNDLISISRHGQVAPLAINVSPELLAEVEALFQKKKPTGAINIRVECIDDKASFIEVENDQGASIGIGTMTKQDDGTTLIRITAEEVAAV